MLWYAEESEAGNRGIDEKKKTNSLKDDLVAMSRALAKTQINWSLEERKLFFMCLTKIRWNKAGNNNVVELDKKEIVDALNLKLDSNVRGYYLREAFRKLALHSEVSWTDPKDKEVWEDGFLITGRRSTKGKIYVTINPYFMPHLENLVSRTSFLTYWTTDVYGFKSKFAMLLFEELRMRYDTRYLTNVRSYTTKQLKDIFGLAKEDYVRKNGSFDRSNFEKYTLDKAIEEINQTQMMSIICIGKKKNGQDCFYEKVKKNGFVAGYKLRYVVRPRQMQDIEPDDIVSIQEDGQIDGQMSLFDLQK